jgi:RND family efflux transporter MFP subunit
MRRIPVAAVFAALLSAHLLSACSHGAHRESFKAPVPVKVKPVTQVGDTSLARYSGSLEPIVRVDLAFRVGGYVEALGQVRGTGGQLRSLQEGDFVKQGSMLARVRSADYSQKVQTARAGISQARAEVTLADAEFSRAQRLFATNSISKAELDAKQARSESAHANVEAAVARAGEAGVALEDTVLKAPMDGVVLWRDLEVGTLVSPGRNVLTVADVRTVKAKFAVPEALVEKLSVGSPLRVQVSAERDSATPERMLDASITHIAPSADTKGRVFSVEAELPNASGALRTGSVVSIHIPEASLAAPKLSVPLSAVVRAPNDPRSFAVFVIDGDSVRGRAKIQPVSLGDILGNAVVVESGLRVGQRVVTVGATLIRDGGDAVLIP